MSVSCSCETGDYDWYGIPNSDYSVLETKRGRRCMSCNHLIKVNELVRMYQCYRPPNCDIEESIHGDEVNTPNKYYCENWADLSFSIESSGMCFTLGENLKESLKEYIRDNNEY